MGSQSFWIRKGSFVIFGWEQLVLECADQNRSEIEEQGASKGVVDGHHEENPVSQHILLIVENEEDWHSHHAHERQIVNGKRNHLLFVVLGLDASSDEDERCSQHQHEARVSHQNEEEDPSQPWHQPFRQADVMAVFGTKLLEASGWSADNVPNYKDHLFFIVRILI